jgi:hypothetical protein
VARPRYPRTEGPLPPPLPPESRTVGQLVAEAARLYGRRFWASLGLGLGIALPDQIFAGSRAGGAPAATVVGAVFLTAAYVGASVVVAPERPSARTLATAYGVGVLAYVPFAVLVLGFVLPGLAWLALVGLVVPVVVVERRAPRAAFARAVELARADYIHALGSLATLTILLVIVRLVLFFLLRGAGGAADRVAILLADMIVAPVVFLGAALLYFDQAARVKRVARDAV